MAALGSQTIAASYEQLLHVDTDGGGDTTTLVPIKDGDNGTTFCLQLATTSALIVDDAKLYFGTGSDAYIEYDEDGTDTWDFSPPAGGMKILDDKKLVFGTDSDASFEYDEDGADNLSIAGADVSIANGIGLIVGNTAQVAMGEVTSEVQILGTTETDACLAIGLASTTDALSPSLKFVKGAHATIGNHSVTVADNEELGKIQAYGSDATDSDTLSSEIAFNIDDDGVGTGTLGGEILLKTSGKDGTLDTAVTVDSSQNVTIAGNLSVTGTGVGATSINGLSDCLIEDNSIYMGNDPSGTTSSAERNIAVGTTALDAVTSGDNNVCIGYDAGTNITRAYNTVCIGAYAGDAIDTVGDDARDNTCIGHDAGKAFDRWGGTFVGHESGHDQRDGHTCTYIGYGTSASSNNEDVETVIGGNAPGQGANCMSLGATSITTLYSQQTSITGYSSDERTKENVEDLDMKGLEFINELKMKKFNWINPADYPDDIRDRRYDEGHEHQIPRPDDNTKKDIGMIAQDVIETMESLDMDMQEQFSPTKKPAWGSSDNVRTLTYGNFIYPLIKAVQELSAKNEELSAKVEALENE